MVNALREAVEKNESKVPEIQLERSNSLQADPVLPGQNNEHQGYSLDDAHLKKVNALKKHLYRISVAYQEVVAKGHEKQNQQTASNKEMQFMKLLNSQETFRLSSNLQKLHKISKRLTGTDNPYANIKTEDGQRSPGQMYLDYKPKVISWLGEVLDQDIPATSDLLVILRSGDVLCQLCIAMYPNIQCALLSKGPEFTIHKIIFFLELCKTVGLKPQMLFSVSDLLLGPEDDPMGKSALTVLRCICFLERQARKKGWDGPVMVLKEKNGTGEKKRRSKRVSNAEFDNDHFGHDEQSESFTSNKQKTPPMTPTGAYNFQSSNSSNPSFNRAINGPSFNPATGTLTPGGTTENMITPPLSPDHYAERESLASTVRYSMAPTERETIERKDSTKTELTSPKSSYRPLSGLSDFGVQYNNSKLSQQGHNQQQSDRDFRQQQQLDDDELAFREDLMRSQQLQMQVEQEELRRKEEERMQAEEDEKRRMAEEEMNKIMEQVAYEKRLQDEQEAEAKRLKAQQEADLKKRQEEQEAENKRIEEEARIRKEKEIEEETARQRVEQEILRIQQEEQERQRQQREKENREHELQVAHWNGVIDLKRKRQAMITSLILSEDTYVRSLSAVATFLTHILKRRRRRTKRLSQRISTTLETLTASNPENPEIAAAAVQNEVTQQTKAEAEIEELVNMQTCINDILQIHHEFLEELRATHLQCLAASATTSVETTPLGTVIESMPIMTLIGQILLRLSTNIQRPVITYSVVTLSTAFGTPLGTTTTDAERGLIISQVVNKFISKTFKKAKRNDVKQLEQQTELGWNSVAGISKEFGMNEVRSRASSRSSNSDRDDDEANTLQRDFEAAVSAANVVSLKRRESSGVYRYSGMSTASSDEERSVKDEDWAEYIKRPVLRLKEYRGFVDEMFGGESGSSGCTGRDVGDDELARDDKRIVLALLKMDAVCNAIGERLDLDV
ncbi:hypothetical protein HK098_005404 [Nowakowskiella sp. JEL0407]|nr:hypothetical protein HK098_005404 [Nowakowskiella sp. JEL0407]